MRWLGHHYSRTVTCACIPTRRVAHQETLIPSGHGFMSECVRAAAAHAVVAERLATAGVWRPTLVTRQACDGCRASGRTTVTVARYSPAHGQLESHHAGRVPCVCQRVGMASSVVVHATVRLPRVARGSRASPPRAVAAVAAPARARAHAPRLIRGWVAGRPARRGVVIAAARDDSSSSATTAVELPELQRSRTPGTNSLLCHPLVGPGRTTLYTTLVLDVLL